MTAPIYVFIATKTTYEAVVPVRASSQADFNRKVTNAFAGNAGGQVIAGDLKIRPTGEAITNHLICDGTVLDIRDFPQLYDFLQTTFGGDGITTFALPNYSNDVLAMPELTTSQVVDPGGTVTDGTPPPPPPPSGPGQTGGTPNPYPPSGGRPRDPGGDEREV